ncbi:MAG: glycine zipper 2TM domain-containing protein [Gammaproteobacteria bacterium]|nr:glycine zipper 2TM domain-containing protein [Gammaproteobacteria bacterium]
MKTFNTTFAIVILLLSQPLMADHKHNKNKAHHRHNAQFQHYDYARVIKATPIYREVRVSNPVRECWDEPVNHSRRHKSADGIIAGGLIGGIVGHQIGKGRGKKLATAVGAILGAQIGHKAVNSHASSGHSDQVEYQQHCKTHQQVSYEEVVEAYDVTYRYKGERYRIEMPYHPGKRIKMRIQVSPVI